MSIGKLESQMSWSTSAIFSLIFHFKYGNEKVVECELDT